MSKYMSEEIYKQQENNKREREEYSSNLLEGNFIYIRFEFSIDLLECQYSYKIIMYTLTFLF